MTFRINDLVNKISKPQNLRPRPVKAMKIPPGRPANPFQHEAMRGVSIQGSEVEKLTRMMGNHG